MDAKVCQLCGEDCSDRPRTKDRKGHYFCTVCYEAAVAERQAHGPPNDVAHTEPAFERPIADLAPVPAVPRGRTTGHRQPVARRIPDVNPWWVSISLLAIFGLLAILGATGVISLAIMVIALLLYTIGVYVVIVVRAFGRSIGSGFLCLLVPLFIGYFGLVKDGSRLVRHLLTVASIGVVLLLLAGGARMATIVTTGGGFRALIPPRVNDPTTFRNPMWQFAYPGNWYIDMRAEGHDSYGDVTVEATDDSYCRLIVYRTDRTLEEELGGSIQQLRPTFTTLEETDRFTRWGVYDGVGREFTAETPHHPYHVRVFATTLADGVVFEAWEVSPVSAIDRLEPGYALIRNTMRIIPDAPGAP